MKLNFLTVTNIFQLVFDFITYSIVTCLFFFLRNRQHALSTCSACLCNWESSPLWTDAETLNQCFDFPNGKATVCWYLVHCQMCTYSHLMLILTYETNYWIKISKKAIIQFFHCEGFFSSIHCWFVYLCFHGTCLWCISALKEEKNMNKL